ncbi:MAG TPA: hypothetical protein EYQ24_15280 [Bacteroidetes bacterium]|nr:hypothetical protein [Bacteroidota bacterium]HIL58250.1 hypothetical protein [Rhodothermales bacterium]
MTLSTRTPLALALLCALTLAACDTAGPGNGPDDLSVAFDWSGRIQIIEDCELGGSNTGDFRFTVEVLAEIDGRTSRETVLDRDFAANTGTSVGVADAPTEFTVPSGADATFTVSFYAVERDAISSDDLGITETVEHTVSGGRLSPTGTQRITLSDGSTCRVELAYSASTR